MCMFSEKPQGFVFVYTDVLGYLQIKESSQDPSCLTFITLVATDWDLSSKWVTTNRKCLKVLKTVLQQKLHQNTNPRNHKQVHRRRRAQKFNGCGIPYPRPWSRAWQFLPKQNPREMFKRCVWVKISKHGCWSFFSMQICYTSNPQIIGCICSRSWINQLIKQWASKAFRITN